MLIIILILLFLVFLIFIYIASNFLTNKYKRLDDETIKNNQAIILLGSGLVKIDGKVLLNNRAYSRVLEACRIYFLAKQCGIHYKIIASGGDIHNFGISEAEAYSDIMLNLGVDKQDIFLERNSLNTFGNAKFTKEIVKELAFDKYLLVTSSLHMKRAERIFTNMGIKIIPAISDTPSKDPIVVTHETLGIVRSYLYNYN
ncbi:YdcF family protein [Pseudofrancisella aestuarii]|uniref:YdcF family protein n=1 Tax=Pseudofrancisella aestuarii TaxID=2670347 RepID=A0ABV9T922_9GAMM|nr:YdcF family protein [Pseudofrancisella aestuarii]